MKIDHHKYRISWSDEDQEYVGTCDEFPSLSWLAKTPCRALRGIRRAVSNECSKLVGSMAADWIISRWPRWKQKVGLTPMKNTCNRCGDLLHQTGICNRCDLEL